jgi:hypothetical protein
LYCPCHFLIFGFVLPFQQISAIKEILTTISVEVENNTSFDQINNMPGIRIDQYSKSILPERTIVPLKLMHYVVLPNITSASRNHFAPPSSVTQLLTIDSSTHSKNTPISLLLHNWIDQKERYFTMGCQSICQSKQLSIIDDTKNLILQSFLKY